MIMKTLAKKAYRAIHGRKMQRRDSVYFMKGVLFDAKTIFEGNNLIGNDVIINKSRIGKGTYIAKESRFIRADIGRFCSIGQNVRNAFGRHPSQKYVSTHPAFFSIAKQAGFTFADQNNYEEHLYVDPEKKYFTKIGNDVWIGNDVMIMDGVTVGDGAILGAGAVVTKSVEPYCIVGGVPARVIKKRFTDEQIEKLILLKWWDKDWEWIKRNWKAFQDIDKFLKMNQE